MKFLMKIFAVAVATLTGAQAYAANNGLMTCRELTEGGRRLDIVATTSGLQGILEGRTAPLKGVSHEHFTKLTFQNGNWEDADFLSLEIASVNGRFIGVMYEPNPQGPAAYTESVFQCAEIMNGSASSSGG